MRGGRDVGSAACAPLDAVAQVAPAALAAPVAPVGIRCFRHEGIVLTNRQRGRGLEWLAGAWELVPADGRVLRAPAELPALCAGETAAVPLPFALPRDGGEMWLTLRVTAAVDGPWAPYGTEVCAPRVLLCGATAAPERQPVDAPSAHPGEPVRQPGRLLHLAPAHRSPRTTTPPRLHAVNSLEADGVRLL
ncbi:DUF4981 domain-containing protein [Streptomyces sp. NPDC048297]|uniref:DUF4981 domain-containing protein n=1 Tax=Streptomyces sp. NPDC048297 TaxID=3365531 RepID=UPI003723488F